MQEGEKVTLNFGNVYRKSGNFEEVIRKTNYRFVIILFSAHHVTCVSTMMLKDTAFFFEM
jgi:hypothetical protein